MSRPVCLAALLGLLLTPPVLASGSSIEVAATCLTDSTSGRDRKDLVKWIFLAMASHPEISALAVAEPATVEDSNARVGALMTRLVAEDCAEQMRQMLAEHGSTSMTTAFETLGGVAMDELMAHPDVSKAFADLERHFDQAKIDAALSAD